MAKVSFGNGFTNMMLLRMKKKVTKQKEEIKEKQEEDVKREQLRALEEAALTAQQQNVMASTVLALAGDKMLPSKKPVCEKHFTHSFPLLALPPHSMFHFLAFFFAWF